MAESKKVQLYTDRECTIEAFPETSARYVTLSDGLDLESVLKHDLTAPTVTHEEISFKVGKGDIDVSSSIVDGEPSKVVIKGKTYQNILPEPSLRNSMKNGKSMQKFNTGYDSVNVVDGVVKSAILSGKTLVNLLPSLDKFAYNGTNTSINTAENSFKLVQDDTAEHVQSLLSNLVINKTYILIYEVTESTLQTDSFVIVNTPEPNAVIKLPRTIGVNRVKFTQRVLTSNNHVFRFAISSLEAQNGNYINVKNPMLIEYQEGMENWDIPYFAGMTSVKMPVLSSFGKNLISYLPLLEKDGLKFAHGNNTTEVVISGTCTNSVSDYYFARATTEGYIDTQVTKILRNAPVGTKFYLSNNLGKECHFGVCRSGSSTVTWIGGANGYEVKAGDTYVRAFVRFNQGDTYNGETLKIQLEMSSSVTTLEPYKSNILSLSEEVVLRSLPNGVKDTYNVVTKEYVRRIGETTLDGTQAMWKFEERSEVDYCVARYKLTDTIYQSGVTNVNLNCDRFKTGIIAEELTAETIKVHSQAEGYNEIRISIQKSKLSSVDSTAVGNYLSQNNTRIQYELATPIIKTVDLSSFGNWENVVLNGSESWGTSTPMQNNTLFVQLYIGNIAGNGFCKEFKTIDSDSLWVNDSEGISFNKTYGGIQIRMNKKYVSSSSEFKQYLQANPITVWYQTSTQKSNSIKEILSFSNGHIQLSSGVENSLIPSIDYEVPTSNSYHMDLLKTNTVYTMKSDSASGTCSLGKYSVIDLLTNKTFSISQGYEGDKLLVVNGSWTNPMILEGDVTSKTIPYFKGIKSAFENEDKIEVLLTGKNLFDGKFEMGVISASGSLGDSQYAVRTVNYIRVKPNTHYRVKINEYVDGGLIYIHEYDKNKNVIKEISTTLGFVSSNETHYVKINTHNREDRALTVDSTMQFEETTSISPYELYKSNDVKIPLLKPSRSILGGVYDEIILDRENNKAKVIQRVGKIILNGGQEYIYESAYQRFYTPLNTLKKQKYYISSLLSDKGEILNHYTGLLDDYTGAIGITGYPDSANNYPNSNWLYFKVKNITTISELKQYLSLNPITVYYELATPIVTEVDIEGFPYIYKDGHIFLNSEIAPQVEVTYISNQTQQIKANNETLIRHEIDIDSLEGLIAGFIEADYQLRLFQFDYDMLKSEKETTI